MKWPTGFRPSMRSQTILVIASIGVDSTAPHTPHIQYQKMTPTMGDPRQAKMMLIMPVVFTFMFLNLPSGLVLYWTLSNVLQIAQQLYMERGSSTQRTTGRVANKKA